MKKQFVKNTLLVLATLGLLSGNALALPFVDYLNFPDQTMTPTSSYTYTFNLNFDPLYADPDLTISTTIAPSDIITDATLYINTGNVGINAKSYKYTLDSDPLGSGVFVSSTTDGIYVPISVSAYLSTDHILSVTITSSGFLAGSFTLESSLLYGEYLPVPEPASMLLFGVGLIGITGLTRRKN